MLLTYAILFIIITSYLAGSILLKKERFYFFDVVWRLTIILGVIFLGKIKVNFSFYQWLFLIILFTIELFFVRQFYSKTRVIHAVGSTLCLSVVAPLAEELLFRGLLLSLIEGSQINKVIVLSSLFGLYHIKNVFLKAPFSLMYQILYASFIFGPALAWIKLSTNSLFLCVVLHSVNNTIGITFTKKYLPFINRRKSEKIY
jgi:membrane protease YdiL (CAAX protease family)